MATTTSKPKRVIDIVNDCDAFLAARHEGSDIYAFIVDGVEPPLGYMVLSTVESFHWPSGWRIEHQTQTVTLLAASLAERDALMHATLQAEREQGTFKLLKK